MPDAISMRIRRVAENILETESLTSDLDDSAAKELLDWGLSVVQQIAQGTANVEDEQQAEQAMFPRVQATRRLMRAVGRWIVSQREGDTTGRDEAFSSILEQASIVYGRPVVAIQDEWPLSLEGTQPEQAGDLCHRIAHLRQQIERGNDRPTDLRGENDPVRTTQTIGL